MDATGRSNDLTSLPDEALIGRIAAGDSTALGTLYDRYGRLAYGLAYRMLADGTAAEDVVQEAYVAIWRNAASYDPRRGQARAWLMTAVRNRCIDVLRGPRRPLKLGDPIDDFFDLQSADDVWETVLQNLQAQDVRKALNTLPADQRATIDLAYFGGLTQTQIAAQMRVPLGTVKGRMRLALEKLRELLATGRGFEPVVEGQ
jgi:RNA polymerase sigma-70 factor (ECF subfamily)